MRTALLLALLVGAAGRAEGQSSSTSFGRQLGKTLRGRGSRAGPPDHFSALYSPSQECTGVDPIMSDGSTIGTARASGAYCQKLDGSLVWLTNNQIRWSGLGIEIEESRTNVLLQNNALENAAWSGSATVTTDTAAGTWGGTSMDTVASSPATDSRSQCAAVSSSTGAFTASAYARAVSGTHTATLAFGCAGGPNATACTCMRDDGSSCTVATTAGKCFATSTFTTTVDRLEVTASCDAAVTSICLEAWGGDRTATGSHQWGMAQLEVGEFASSPMPTTATAFTRVHDTPSVMPTVAIAVRGCYGGEFWIRKRAGFLASSSQGGDVAVILDDQNRIYASDSGGNTVYSNAATGDIRRRWVKFRTWWDPPNKAADIDGITGTPGTLGNELAKGTIFFGSNVGVLRWMNGRIRNIEFGDSGGECRP